MCKKDTKKLYQIVGKFPKSCSSNKLPQICSTLELPNAFANFFQSKIFTLHQYLSTNQLVVCAPEDNDVVFDGTTFDQFNPVTTADGNNILHSLNSTKLQIRSFSRCSSEKMLFYCHYCNHGHHQQLPEIFTSPLGI